MLQKLEERIHTYFRIISNYTTHGYCIYVGVKIIIRFIYKNGKKIKI